MKRRRLLHLCIELPYPPDSGYKIRTSENIAALSGIAEISSVSFSEETIDPTRLEEFKNSCGVADVIEPVMHNIHITRKPLKLAGAFINSFTKRIPYVVEKFRSKKMEKLLIDLLKQGNFDFIIFDQLRMTGYYHPIKQALGKSPPKFILDTHNVETDLWRQFKEHKRPPSRLLAQLQEDITKDWELGMIEALDKTTTISDLDKSIFIKMGAKPQKLITVPVSMGPSNKLKNIFNPKANKLLLISNLVWEPNRRGLQWFVDEVFPLVRGEIPDIEFIIVGGGWKFGFQDPIKEMGYVRDTEPFYSQAAVFITPLLRGSGVRLKILEAMKRGIPVVSTTIGASGINVSDGKNIIIADDAEDFAKGVIELLRNEEYRNEISKNSFEFILKNHTREASRETYKKILLGD